MPDMSVPFPEGGCKIRLGVIDNRLPEFDGRVRHQMKNYVGKRVNEFGERVHYNYYDSYDEDRIFIPFWFEDGLIQGRAPPGPLLPVYGQVLHALLPCGYRQRSWAGLWNALVTEMIFDKKAENRRK